MRRLAPTLLLLLPGCGFHRPAWNAVTSPPLDSPRSSPLPLAAPDADVAAVQPPRTTYLVAAHTGSGAREWLLQLHLAAGDELVGPGRDDELVPIDENTAIVVVRHVTRLGQRTGHKVAKPRRGQLDWLPLLGNGAWAMAVELDRLDDDTDAAAATAAIIAEERRPLSGLAAVLNLAMALASDWELEEALIATARAPSWFDLMRAHMRLRTFDCSDACEFLTLQPRGSTGVLVEGEHGPSLRQRMTIDLTIGSTHTARMILDTAPTTGPFDLSQGITRVVIQHPGDPGRFVLVERVDLGPTVGRATDEETRGARHASSALGPGSATDARRGRRSASPWRGSRSPSRCRPCCDLRAA